MTSAEEQPGGETVRFEVTEVGAADIDAVMELEAVAFTPQMQAGRDKVLRRFAMGHHMLGAFHQGRLVGSIAFSFMRFSPDAVDRLPRTFAAYSTQPVPEDADTLCIYSLGVVASARGLACTPPLIRASLDMARAQGLRAGTADGPLPSLNGNDQVRPKPAVRRLVDDFVRTGIMPPQEDFLQDPVLALYARLTGCHVIALLPDFIPEDTASGGWRALLYLEF